MRTYASAWIHQNRKLSTCVDAEGRTNPTWNDKFVFRVDDDFLRRDTSAIMIDIFAVHWFEDVLVGTVRVLVGNLIPPPARSHQRRLAGMRFVALQVRRPSGRPQGILNIGVALLDSSMRSMPLYTQLSMSAVGYRDLMEDPPTLQQIQSDENQKKDPNDNKVNMGPDIKPILRRTRSERSEHIIADDHSPNSSIVAFPTKARDAVKESSIQSITDGFDPIKVMKKKGKASSVISGAKLREKPKHNGGNKKSKAGSVLSDSILSKQSSSFHKIDLKETKNNEKIKNHDDDHELMKKPTNEEKSPTNLKEKSTAPTQKHNTTVYEYNAPNPQSKHMIITIPQKKGNNNSVWSDSEVGPSPSEVAAAMAERRLYPLDHHRDDQSSVLAGWSVDESVEGLRSKLARWRTELPPMYDHGGGFSSSSFRSSSRHVRRHTTDGGGDGNGMFSCFGNIFVYECQCVCGKPMGGRRSLSARFHSPSTLTPGRSFL